jgi:crotonobetainyl-CoA:carnitine CoA-transferase CaiB-like acyl-CoA transferase
MRMHGGRQPADSVGCAHPLRGVRVVEIGQVISAPYAGLLLADRGAEGIKVEPPGVGDSARNPSVTGIGDHSATFVTFNRNKKSVALDLKDPGDYAAFCDLIRSADVLVSNVLPKVAVGLGITAAELRELNPRLVTCWIRGFRESDPRSNEPSFDLTHQALAGYMLMEGRPGDPPFRICIPFADLSAAQFAVNAILAALLARVESGHGEDIEVPMYDAMLSQLTYTATLYLNTGKEPARMGSAHEYTAPWQAVLAADGDLVVAVRSQKFWQRFCSAIGQPELVDDPRFADNQCRLQHRDEMTEVLNATFRTHTVEHWLTQLRDAGVPAAPVRTVGEALSEVVAEDNDLVRRFDHPHLGSMLIIGNPIRFGEMSTVEVLPPPDLGTSAPEFGLDSADASGT